MKREPKISSMTVENQERVMAVLRDFAQAYQNKNLQGALAAFADDAEVTTSDGVLCKGAYREIRERLLQEFQTTTVRAISPYSIHLRVAENTASVSTAYKFFEGFFPSHQEQCSDARFNARLRLLCGKWKIECAHFAVLEPAMDESRPVSREIHSNRT